MSRNPTRVSDEAVRDATGRTWGEWRQWLDGQDAGKSSHKEIVALLGEKAGVQSTWWQQMVATGYEKLTGRRKTGQTADVGFEIGVQRTVAMPSDRAWDLLTSSEGMRLWLGQGSTPRLEEGRTYQLADGSGGEVRVVRPGQHLRITWKPDGWRRASTIQARVIAKSEEKSVISFHQEHLPRQQERENRRSHFRSALDGLLKLARARTNGD